MKVMTSGLQAWVKSQIKTKGVQFSWKITLDTCENWYLSMNWCVSTWNFLYLRTRKTSCGLEKAWICQSTCKIAQTCPEFHGEVWADFSLQTSNRSHSLALLERFGTWYSHRAPIFKIRHGIHLEVRLISALKTIPKLWSESLSALTKSMSLIIKVKNVGG